MCRAVSILLQKFPDIRRDLARANQDPKPFIAKVRKVCSDNTHTVWGHIHDYMRGYMRTNICKS